MTSTVNYFTADEMQYLLPAVSSSLSLPRKGEKLRIDHLDGAAAEISLDRGRSADGKKLYRWLNIPSPQNMVGWVSDADLPSFSGVVRCTVRGRAGYAFRTEIGDRLGRAAFIPNTARRAFVRSGWGGSSAPFSMITDMSPASDDDLAGYAAYLHGSEHGWPVRELPPLDASLVGRFRDHILVYANDSPLTESVRHFIISDFNVDSLISRCVNTSAAALAEEFGNLHPANRNKLCHILAPICPEEEWCPRRAQLP
jgi:hypothetical protein